MDTLSLKRIQTSLILILKERDDGTKKRQTLEKTAMSSGI